MVVNPFFLHGSTREQSLQQSLINEQIRMYGMDVYYIPREFVRDASIMREVTSSEFRSYFIIEAYLNNYDGYAGQGDIMSKFGIQVKDEITLTLSRERYEDYIAPFLNSRMLFLMNSIRNTDSLPTIQRPREGDLIYFPLGRRLFEIKFVEHEQPFYQLGTGYTYELQCELFRYEDEVLDTSIDEIDSTIQSIGDITTLSLVRLSRRAEVSVGLASGYIKDLILLNEGSNYTSPPNIIISPPEVGIDPDVITLLTLPDSNIDTSAIKQLVWFNNGAGYLENPTVTFSGGGGSGALARASVRQSLGVVKFDIDEQGSGYSEDAAIVVYDEENNIVAEGVALTDGTKIVKTIITDPGEELTAAAYAVVSEPASSGEGTYIYNEIVEGSQSGTQARIRGWDQVTLELQLTNLDPEKNDVFFTPGEVITGKTSGAQYSVKAYSDKQAYQDEYTDNDNIGEVAEVVVDTSEYNQFAPEAFRFDDDEVNFNDEDPFGDFS